MQAQFCDWVWLTICAMVLPFTKKDTGEYLTLLGWKEFLEQSGGCFNN